jgi:hypothetical protein
MLGAVRFAVVLGLLAGPAWVDAQESYQIRLTKAGPGAVLLVEKQDHQEKHVQVFDSTGKALKDQQDKLGNTVVYREKIIAKPEGEGRPTHLQRQFERAERRVGGRISPVPLQGKTYDIEKKNGRYTFQYLGGEALPAEAAQALEREFNSGLQEELDWEKMILPPQPVRVNDVWKFDLARVVKVLGQLTNMQIDASHSSGHASLSRVYEQDKRRFAELDAVINLATTAVVRGTSTRPLEPGSHISLILKLNGCIDGSAEISVVDVHLQMTGVALPQNSRAPSATMKVQFESIIHETRRELPRS